MQMLPVPAVKGLAVPLALCTNNLCLVYVTPLFNIFYNFSSEAFHSNKSHTLVMWGRDREMKKQKLSSPCSQPVAQIFLTVLPF